MEWISVKDKLPNDYQRVLFYDTLGNRSCETDIDTGYFVPSQSKIAESISHWMPLPTPPKTN
jgi:hypothetical protein